MLPDNIFCWRIVHLTPNTAPHSSLLVIHKTSSNALTIICEFVSNFFCESLTFTGLISVWRRGEAFSAILAKPLLDCVTVLCLGKCKSRHWKVFGIMKRTCYFQTNWISYILNWNVRCLCCQWLRFHVLLFWASSNYPYFVGEHPLLRKLKSVFANKNSSLIQTMITFIFVKIYASEYTFPDLWIKRGRNSLRVCTWKFVPKSC